MAEMNQVLASRWKRLGGAILDGLVSIVVTFPVMIVTGVFKQLMQNQGMSVGQTALFFIYGLAIFMVINGYLLAKHGQTVGKWIVGTRIVDKDTGQILSLGKVFGLRYLPLSIVSQIPVLGNLLCAIDTLFIFREDKRCVHDLIAGTKVVDVRIPEPIAEIEA
jgi:uncharacterized RDD family membrane protein YckC